MANLTRRELVLQLLQRHPNEWVDGTAIASAEVGGSEGLKRLRELRQAGYNIRMRKHPDPRRDIFQYRLMESITIPPRNPLYSERPAYVPPASPGMLDRNFPLKKNEDGSIEMVWEVCEECGGRYAVKADHLVGDEHLRWQTVNQTIEGQTTIPDVPQPPVYAYTANPGAVSFGEAAICPRCKGVRRKAKWLAKGLRPADDMCMDPKDHSIYCRRCNGWGVVPNIGPVVSTKPPAPEPDAPIIEAATTEAFTDG